MKQYDFSRAAMSCRKSGLEPPAKFSPPANSIQLALTAPTRYPPLMRLAAILLAFTLFSFAQDSPHHVVTRTRTVALFSDLENQLVLALQHKDKAAIQSLIADDFEIRLSSDPNTPEPGDDWIANELPTYDLHGFRISDMAVHMYADTTAVVSMSALEDAAIHGKRSRENYFIVDVWTKSADNWKLAVRYAAPVEKKPTASHDVKPSGKN